MSARRGDRESESVGRVALAAYAYGLVPFGFGMWLAHYGFHLLTGALTVVPVTQSAAIDLMGWAALGEPLWRWTGMRPGAVFPMQLGMHPARHDGIARRAERNLCAATTRRRRLARPRRGRSSCVLSLAVAAIWILFQPMEMRGIGSGG